MFAYAIKFTRVRESIAKRKGPREEEDKMELEKGGLRTVGVRVEGT